MKLKYLLLPFLLYITLLVMIYNQTYTYAINQAEVRVEEFLENYKALRTYVGKYQKPEIFALQKKGILDKEFFTPNLLSSTFSARTVNKIYNINRIKEDKIPLTIKFASNNARNILNQATPKEAKILKKYNNKVLTGAYKEIEKKKGGTNLLYILPTKLTNKKCMRCHSKPSLAPKQLVEKYGNKNGFYEKVGNMRAIIVTTLNIDDYLTFARQLFFKVAIFITMIFGIILYIFYRFNLKLRNESEATNNILNSQENLIVITSGKELTKSNQGVLDFFGYKTLHDFNKKNECICDFFMHEDGYLQKEQNGKSWLKIILENKEITYQVKIKDLKDNIHFFQINTNGHMTEDSTYVITLTDITDFNTQQHKLEEKTKELHNLNQNLEIKIEEALQENIKQLEILQHQNKMAAMGEMIGAIAHQWRQPLNGINTSIQNLKYDYKDGYLNDEKFVKEFIEKNKITIKFMSKTIDDFMNFFRIDKEKNDFNVKETTQSVIDMQLAQLKSYNITLNITGDEFIYNGLQSEYQQVILNLINNAKDVLVENNIKNPIIDIILKDKTISIKDNAGGIPEDIIDRIFEPYFTTKEQGKGTGIGLYMSKMIIEDNMQASLKVHNDKDGAVFIIDFKEKLEDSTKRKN